jgi:hypothetical protein
VDDVLAMRSSFLTRVVRNPGARGLSEEQHQVPELCPRLILADDLEASLMLVRDDQGGGPSLPGQMFEVMVQETSDRDAAHLILANSMAA